MELIVKKLWISKNICIDLRSYKVILVINYKTDNLKDHWMLNAIITKGKNKKTR